ncbi:MAG: hypothetical protein FJX77_04560, partial [Armatimonadetes bacterium]|nr:hypothetical protein [Armatimonadota bacterium]
RGAFPVPFLAAYGARRGSALGGPQREVDLTSPIAAVATLFDESAGLIHAETWLAARELDALRAPDSADARFMAATLPGLRKLLPGVEEFEITGSGVQVRFENQDPVPLAALSDGYLTTLGWVLDLTARWLEQARLQGVELEPELTRQMTGLVLVDEVDAHLHPRWQRDIVVQLRELFPRMSFVVTTHNPLTLLGARPGEVHVLRCDPSGRPELVQRDIPAATDWEAVLAGPWFELDTLVDPDTARLLVEANAALQADPASADAQELTEQVRLRLERRYPRTAREHLPVAALEEAIRLEEAQEAPLTAESRKAALDRMAQRLAEARAMRKGQP